MKAKKFIALAAASAFAAAMLSGCTTGSGRELRPETIPLRKLQEILLRLLRRM